jgi:2,3-bisphosphoglycerate-independent phosphoglycerate mutase
MPGMAKPVVLIVLDGWGIGTRDGGNPLTRAKLPTFDKLAAYPLTSLEASGIAVGLPWGEVGNSEVGHLTMGAGRVLYQYFPRITIAIKEGTFGESDALRQVAARLKETNGRLHLAGLLTSGHVHASVDHAAALVQWGEQQGFGGRIYVHAFGDGKDSPARSFETLLQKLGGAKLATAMGRHYGMNRDDAWQLTKAAYACMTTPGMPQEVGPLLRQLYDQGLTEEFLQPTLVDPEGVVKPGDAIVFWNFREDSIEQIARCFVSPSEVPEGVPPVQALVATMTTYKESWDVPVLFPKETVERPLGRVISDAGLSQMRVAETYKHAHVTAFFNGYREEPFKDEYRVLIPSLSFPHPDEHPELVASQVTDRIVMALSERSFPFILANYANSDVIPHTGNFDASVRAAEVVDEQLARLLPFAERGEATLLITGDHGNIERVRDPLTGRPQTVHDPNPVPFYLVDAAYQGRHYYNEGRLRDSTVGTLADVAPTVLALMGLEIPAEMTGVSLLKELS